MFLFFYFTVLLNELGGSGDITGASSVVLAGVDLFYDEVCNDRSSIFSMVPASLSNTLHLEQSLIPSSLE